MKKNMMFLAFILFFLMADNALVAKGEEKQETFTDIIGKGKEMIDNEDYAGAINYYTEKTELFPKLPEMQYCLGFSYLKAGDHDNAERIFKKTVEIDPYFSEAYFYLAVINHMKGNLGDTIRNLNRVTDLDARFQSAYYNRGVVYLEINNPREAVKDFAYSLYLKPDDHAAFKYLLQAYEELNRTVEENPGIPDIKTPEGTGKPAHIAGPAKEEGPEKDVSAPVVYLIRSGKEKEVIPEHNGVFEIDVRDVNKTEIEIALPLKEKTAARSIKFLMKGQGDGGKISCKIKSDSTHATPRFNLGKISGKWETYTIDENKVDPYFKFSDIRVINIKFLPSDKQENRGMIKTYISKIELI
ncbi:MAG: tetratricopeptide repeat protein [Candidatus Omnitrophota bacterium]